MDKREGFTISDLEKISGIPRSTIHHYLRYGLLPPPLKTGQTMAYYDQSHLRRLEIIQKIKINYLKTAKTSRIPLDYIKHKISESYSLAKGSNLPVKKTEKRKKKKSPGKRKKLLKRPLSSIPIEDII